MLQALRPTRQDTVAAGALVAVEGDDGSHTVYLLLPGGGGKTLESRRRQIRTVTGRAPIGRALIGAAAGDIVEVRAPDGLRELEILDVT